MSAAESDRELLELAAKAIGYATTSSWNADRMKMATPVIALVVHNDGELVSTGWDPLNEDGPALRLAVKLGLSVYCPDVDDETAVVRNFAGVSVMELATKDPCAATRRAIVRAAAEIGRAMP